MTTGYYQKYKVQPQKEARVIYQNISEEKKTKSVNMHMKGIKIFLKKKKTKNKNIAVSSIKIC